MKQTTISIPLNKDLYNKIKTQVKQSVSVWPSAYASGQLVSRYKRAGGKYKSVTQTQNKKNNKPLNRWFKEQWVNICTLSNKQLMSPCGREKSLSKSKYPYCRPKKRVSKSTPMTVSEMIQKYGRKKIKSMCRKKRKHGLPNKTKKTPKYVSII